MSDLPATVRLMPTNAWPTTALEEADRLLRQGLSISRGQPQPAVLTVALRLLRESMLAVADHLESPPGRDVDLRRVEILSKLRRTGWSADGAAHVAAAALNTTHALDRLAIRVGNERIALTGQRLDMSPDWQQAWSKLGQLHTRLHRLDIAKPADVHILSWFTSDSASSAPRLAIALNEAL